MIVHLQYLRAVAALMVVLFHTLDDPSRLGPEAALPRFPAGAFGVDLFFVISGFIIWWTTRDGRTGPVVFAWRRFARVAPLYWILTLLLAAIAVAAPHLLASTRFDPAHLLASLAFLPWPHPTFDTANPVLFVGWTLNYEMAFYALFALTLLLPARWRLAAAVGALTVLALVGWWAEPEALAARFYTRPVILEFALGLLLGAAVAGGHRVRPRLGALCAGTGLLVLVAAAGGGEHGLLAGVAATLVVAGAVLGDRGAAEPDRPLVRLLGDASYSIYLTHLFVLPVAQIAWVRAGLPVAGWAGLLYPAAALLACALAGVLCHVWLERPLGRMLARIGRPRPVPLPVPIR